MPESFTLKELQERHVLNEEANGAPKPFYITNEGWHERLSGALFVRRGPAPENQEEFPRLMPLGSEYRERLLTYKDPELLAEAPSGGLE